MPTADHEKLDVVVLATQTDHHYQAFISRGVSSASTPSSSSSYYARVLCLAGRIVSIGETVNADDHGDFSVVDTFPTSCGSVTETTAIIVVPPPDDVCPTTGSALLADDEEAAGMWEGALVTVTLRPSSSLHHAPRRGIFCCSRPLYSMLASRSISKSIPEDANGVVLVNAGDSARSHRLLAFLPTEKADEGRGEGDSSERHLLIETCDAEDWSNLRAWSQSFSGSPLFGMRNLFGEEGASPSDDPRSFMLPLHLLLKCDEKDGEEGAVGSSPRHISAGAKGGLNSAILSSNAADLAVARVVLTPALPHAALVLFFGETYADVIEKSLQQSGLLDDLNGSIISEGDLVTISVPLCSPAVTESKSKDRVARKGQLDDIEVAMQHIFHMAGGAAFGGVHAGLEGPSMRSSLILVASDVTTRSLRGSGIFVSSESANGSVSPTVISVTFRPSTAASSVATQWISHASDTCVAHDHPFTERVRAAFREITLSSSSSDGETRVVVLNASMENLGVACACCAAESSGYIPLVLDGRSTDDHLLAAIIESCTEARPKHGAAVMPIIRHSEALPLQGLAMTTLLGGRQQKQASLLEQQNGAFSSPPPLVVVLWESPDPVAPRVGSLSCNSHGVLRAAVPDEAERTHLVRCVIGRWSDVAVLSRFLSAKVMSQWTSGLTAIDVIRFVQFTFVSLCCTRPWLRRGEGSDQRAAVRFILSYAFADECLHQFQRQHGHNVVSTKLQPVKWSDVGGLEEAKKEILESVQMPILYPDLFASGAKRRAGILLYGPPGCGKTLLAKAVATELNMNFLSVKGPELINQYVGESEKNVRTLFQRARDNSPCIVFFDELDALAPARGAKGDAGGAMDRIVSQLLVEVDGVTSKKSDGTDAGLVFIIGATNRPDLLDPSLLRPGRFDRLCYLGVPSTKDEQLFAVKALTRKFNLSQDVDLRQVIEPLDFVFTGADFFALCSDAMMLSVEEQIEEARAWLEKKKANAASDLNIAKMNAEDDDDEEDDEGSAGSSSSGELCVRMDHFLQARSKLKASVTKNDLKKYEALRFKFAAASSTSSSPTLMD